MSPTTTPGSDERAAARRGRGPTDPGRRDRLAEAALRIAVRDGLTAVSHRAVAREAEVPLGSTTYHYAGLDDLLDAAMRRAAASYREELEPLLTELERGEEPARAIVRGTLDYLGEDGHRAAVEYELYATAVRREALRESATAWAEVLPRALAPHLGLEAADAVSVLIDGTCVRAALTGVPPEAGVLERRVACLLAPEPPGDAGRPAGGR